MAKQWVGSPLAGQIVNICLIGVSVAGMTLEMVLERPVEAPPVNSQPKRLDVSEWL